MFRRFLKSLLYLVSIVLYPIKQKNICMYGSGFNNFIGHSKYEFLKNSNSKNAYWIASSQCEYHDLTDKSLPVLLKYSFKHILLSICARKFIITHNVSDIFPLKPYGCEVINLWHGVAVKYIGYDSPVEKVWIDRKLASNIPLPYSDWDTVVAQSEYHKYILMRAMNLESNNIIVREPMSIRFLAENHRVSDANCRKTVLYMPTFRNSNSNHSYVYALNKVLKYFNSYEGGVRVLAKLHPLVKISELLEDFKDVSFVPHDRDPIEVMINADILVTDYSSAMYDFSITGCPIYLIHDDYEAYISENGGVYPIKIKYRKL